MKTLPKIRPPSNTRAESAKNIAEECEFALENGIEADTMRDTSTSQAERACVLHSVSKFIHGARRCREDGSLASNVIDVCVLTSFLLVHFQGSSEK